MTKTLTALLLAAGVMSGCTLAPHYDRPAPPVAAGYPAAPEGYATAEVKTGELAPDPAYPPTRRQLLLLRAQQAVLLARLAFEPLQQGAHLLHARRVRRVAAHVLVLGRVGVDLEQAPIRALAPEVVGVVRAGRIRERGGNLGFKRRHNIPSYCSSEFTITCDG